MPSCVVKNCKNNSKAHKKYHGVTFHLFPVNNEIIIKWIVAIRKSRNDPEWLPSKTSVVCSDHFNSNDLYTTNRGLRRVTRTGYPKERLRDPSEANSNDTELETSSDETDVETEQPISSGNTSPYQQCNAQVTHAEKIQEDVTKAFIAKVFHYLEHEFEVLKKMDAEMILSNLSKLLYRTAMATGVSETTVLEILQEEARRSAGTQESGSQGELQVPVEFTGQPRKPTRKRRRVYKKQNLDESSSEASDGSIEEVASSSIAQDTTIEPDGELMVMKAEPFEYYNEEPAINIQPVNPTAVNKEQTQVDPISLDVKEESADDDELNDCIETLARQSASSRRRTYGKRDVISTHGQNQMDPDSSDVKMEQPDGQTRRQEDYCTPGTSRSHRPVIELDGRCLLRVGAVKEESENEEGFS